MFKDKPQPLKKKGDDLVNNIRKLFSHVELLMNEQKEFWGLAKLSAELTFPAQELIVLWRCLNAQMVALDGKRKDFTVVSEESSGADPNSKIFGTLSKSFQNWIDAISDVLLGSDAEVFYKNLFSASQSLERLIHQLSEGCIDQRVLLKLRSKGVSESQYFMELRSFWHHLEHFLRKWLYAAVQFRVGDQSGQYSFLLTGQDQLKDVEKYCTAKLMSAVQDSEVSVAEKAQVVSAPGK